MFKFIITSALTKKMLYQQYYYICQIRIFVCENVREIRMMKGLI